MAQTRVGVRLRPTLWNGLLAYYTGDNTPNDILGNYNGTLVNGTTCGDGGVIKKGFKFDGVNDYVNMGNVLDFDGSTPFSFSLWSNPSNLSGVKTLFRKYDTSTGEGYVLFYYNGQLWFYLRDGNSSKLDIRTSSSYTTAITHITLSYDGSRTPNGLKIYVNGVSQTLVTISNTLTSSTSNTGNLTLGSAGGAGLSPIGGIIDEVGIWNRELSASEVTDLYNSGNAKQHPTLTGIDPFWNEAIAYYTGNDTTYDPIGYYSGTLVNGASYANDGIIYDDEGNVDKSFSIDKSLLQNVTTTSPPHNYATETTYNMWVKPSSLPGFCMFLYIPTGIIGPGIGLRPGGNLTFFRGSVNGDAKSGVYLVTDVWQMVTIVYRPWAGYGTNNVDFYINGSLVASKPLSVSSVGGSNMYIGSNGAGNGVYDGLIDEVSIWNTDLSPSKITELYNSGS